LAAAVALLLVGSGVSAEPREPLVVTELREPVLVPQSGTGQADGQSLDEATRRFSLAVALAIETEQRSVQQACSSRAPAPVAAAAKWSWQANCAYRRH
jgi:hypothetical protein